MSEAPDAARLAGDPVPIEPVCLRLAYRPERNEGARVLEFDVRGQGASAAEDESVEARVDIEDGRLEVSVTARIPIWVTSCEVLLRHAFTSTELVLLNGYQSWTDTAERSPWARMRGLHGVPKRLVKRYSFDTIGDYTFIDYPARRGLQHGFTYVTFRRGDAVALVGSLDESQGFTVIRTNAGKGEVTLSPECPQRIVGRCESVRLGSYAIVSGSEDECYDRWFELSGIRPRPARPLVGYTSWYRHYGDISERKLERDLAGMVGELSSMMQRVEGCEKLFQIDDGYCKVGDWLEHDVRKFPHGLAPLADEIARAGFVPGLWVAPFVCERESRVFKERSDWLLCDADGNPVPTGSHWSGGYALDTRNPDVRTYVLDVLDTMTRKWGFKLLKADFLYAACLMPHDGMTRGQLMADAMDLLRKGAGESTLVLGCGVPLASAFGVVDYCRIGCDVGLDWDDKPHMRLLHRERVSTKNSLGNTHARRPLDGRAFGNDPDVFFLRDDVGLSPERRDELMFADAASGSVFLTSDDMGAWSEDVRSRYAEALEVFCARKVVK